MIDKPTLEELALINGYMRNTATFDNVYVFTVTLCDNDVDKDNKRFTTSALYELKKLFVGKTAIIDENPHIAKAARIISCTLEHFPNRKTKLGDGYCRLTAKAFIKRNEENKALIEAIESKALSEVSIGCAVTSERCSICGDDYNTCRHKAGRKYGSKLCCVELDEPTDVYEWSFVAKPNKELPCVDRTPEAAIIRLNQLRTDKGERPPEIDMAIRAINCCMIKRKPIDHVEGGIEYPACGMSIDEFDSERYCFNCGQALDWRNT